MRIAPFAAVLMLAVSPAVAQDGALNESGVEKRLRDYVRVWESDERVGPAAMQAYYADQVIYYGKSMSRRGVLADKIRFIRTYPSRSYDIAPGSVRTQCRGGECRARAILEWRRSTRAGATQSGASELTLVFSAAAGGRIVRESARTLRGSR